jgi:mRNA-degrading endonuclease toxin of MazEF toxin-antitoxin module
MRRGDVVIVAFPFATGGGGKNRPAVVVQCDRDKRRLSNTIVAMITGNISYASSKGNAIAHHRRALTTAHIARVSVSKSWPLITNGGMR